MSISNHWTSNSDRTREFLELIRNCLHGLAASRARTLPGDVSDNTEELEQMSVLHVAEAISQYPDLTISKSEKLRRVLDVSTPDEAAAMAFQSYYLRDLVKMMAARIRRQYLKLPQETVIDVVDPVFVSGCDRLIEDEKFKRVNEIAASFSGVKKESWDRELPRIMDCKEVSNDDLDEDPKTRGKNRKRWQRVRIFFASAVSAFMMIALTGLAITLVGSVDNREMTHQGGSCSIRVGLVHQGGSRSIHVCLAHQGVSFNGNPPSDHQG